MGKLGVRSGRNNCRVRQHGLRGRDVVGVVLLAASEIAGERPACSPLNTL